MSVVYSLYDALVSINVPDDKAKAVIDALEREMMDKLATKSDIDHFQNATQSEFANLRELNSKELLSVRTELGKDMQLLRSEMGHFREMISADIKPLATRAELSELGRSLTTQFYLTAGGSVVLTCTILGAFSFLR
jgi:hypothetical protein